MKKTVESKRKYQEAEKYFLELPIKEESLLPIQGFRGRKWSYDELLQCLSEVITHNPEIQTLTDYRKWRLSLGHNRSEYPSLYAIDNLIEEEFDEIRALFMFNKKKWTYDTIMSCLNRFKRDCEQGGFSFTPTYYREWRKGQAEEAPSYTTINETVGSFKQIREMLEVEDLRFEKGSNRPKKWTKELIWECLEEAYSDLTVQNVEFTQQNFVEWREKKLKTNVKVPALSTIREMMGVGGFPVWKHQLKGLK